MPIIPILAHSILEGSHHRAQRSYKTDALPRQDSCFPNFRCRSLRKCTISHPSVHVSGRARLSTCTHSLKKNILRSKRWAPQAEFPPGKRQPEETDSVIRTSRRVRSMLRRRLVKILVTLSGR